MGEREAGRAISPSASSASGLLWDGPGADEVWVLPEQDIDHLGDWPGLINSVTSIHPRVYIRKDRVSPTRRWVSSMARRCPSGRAQRRSSATSSGPTLCTQGAPAGRHVHPTLGQQVTPPAMRAGTGPAAAPP